MQHYMINPPVLGLDERMCILL